MLNRDIFRAYDIRGLVERDLSKAVVEDLGRAIGQFAREKKAQTLAVGRDARLSSPRLRDNLIQGLRETGIEVIDIGQVPTPVLYFAVHYWNLDGGIMITGSHNPPEYNGFKILIQGETLHGASIQTLANYIEDKNFPSAQGSVVQKEIDEIYVQWIAEHMYMGDRKLKVVVDGGNGMGGPLSVQLYEKLGMEVIPLFIEPNGYFPNHHPDPTVEENLRDLQKKVLQVKADLGIAFDGDADRIGVVDDQGHILWGDRLMILFARSILKDEPQATILGEVKCSQTLYDDIQAHGGRPIMWKTGHSFIKAKMKESQALLAGEMSGHIFFKHRYFGFDDAIYSGARLLEILSQDLLPLSQMLNDIPQTYATPEIRIDCPEDQKFKVAQKLAKLWKDKGEMVTIDGIRIRFEDGAWALVRASNTQPVLVMRVEANDPQRRDELAQWVRSYIQC